MKTHLLVRGHICHYKGLEITIKANANRLIYWCSHWELIDDLKAYGVVRSESGPMHHRDYYFLDDDNHCRCWKQV